MRPRGLRTGFFITLTALTVIVTTLASFAHAQTPRRGGTLRVPYGNEIAHLDFHTAPGYEMMWGATNVGCGLINITPDRKFLPDLAEPWSSSPRGLLHTYQLPRNPPVHHGTRTGSGA